MNWLQWSILLTIVTCVSTKVELDKKWEDVSHRLTNDKLACDLMSEVDDLFNFNRLDNLVRYRCDQKKLSDEKPEKTHFCMKVSKDLTITGMIRLNRVEWVVKETFSGDTNPMITFLAIKKSRDILKIEFDKLLAITIDRNIEDCVDKPQKTQVEGHNVTFFEFTTEIAFCSILYQPCFDLIDPDVQFWVTIRDESAITDIRKVHLSFTYSRTYVEKTSTSPPSFIIITSNSSNETMTSGHQSTSCHFTEIETRPRFRNQLQSVVNGRCDKKDSSHSFLPYSHFCYNKPNRVAITGGKFRENQIHWLIQYSYNRSSNHMFTIYATKKTLTKLDIVNATELDDVLQITFDKNQIKLVYGQTERCAIDPKRTQRVKNGEDGEKSIFLEFITDNLFCDSLSQPCIDITDHDLYFYASVRSKSKVKSFEEVTVEFAPLHDTTWESSLLPLRPTTSTTPSNTLPTTSSIVSITSEKEVSPSTLTSTSPSPTTSRPSVFCTTFIPIESSDSALQSVLVDCETRELLPIEYDTKPEPVVEEPSLFEIHSYAEFVIVVVLGACVIVTICLISCYVVACCRYRRLRKVAKRTDIEADLPRGDDGKPDDGKPNGGKPNDKVTDYKTIKGHFNFIDNPLYMQPSTSAQAAAGCVEITPGYEMVV